MDILTLKLNHDEALVYDGYPKILESWDMVIGIGIVWTELRRVEATTLLIASGQAKRVGSF